LEQEAATVPYGEEKKGKPLEMSLRGERAEVCADGGFPAHNPRV
jgi:hypothetical protein